MMSRRYTFAGHPAIGAYVDARLAEAGWRRCEDVSSADAVLTYFTYTGQLEDAYFDSEGLLKTAAPKCLLIDLSPSTPSFARELSAIASVHDYRVIEAPLAVIDPTLPEAFADAENVRCFVAGEKEDVEDALEILNALAGTLVVLERSGSAQLAKAVDTIQHASQAVAAIESEALFRTWQESTNSVDRFDGEMHADTPLMEHVLQAAAKGHFRGSFTVEMAMAEVVAAMTAADDVELILPQLEACMHLLELLVVVGGPDLTPAALALMFRDEEACAPYGIDWSRAQGLFASDEHDHDHDHDHDDYYDDDDGYMFDDDDLNGLSGGFGGYSKN